MEEHIPPGGIPEINAAPAPSAGQAASGSGQGGPAAPPPVAQRDPSSVPEPVVKGPSAHVVPPAESRSAEHGGASGGFCGYPSGVSKVRYLIVIVMRIV